MLKLDYYNQYSFRINDNSSYNDKILAFIYSSLCRQAYTKGKHTIDNFYIDDNEYFDYTLYIRLDNSDNIHNVDINLQEILQEFSIYNNGRLDIDFEVVIENLSINNNTLVNFNFNNKVTFRNVIFRDNFYFKNVNFNNFSYFFLKDSSNLNIYDTNIRDVHFYGKLEELCIINSNINFNLIFDSIKVNKIKINNNFGNCNFDFRNSNIENVFFDNIRFRDTNNFLNIDAIKSNIDNISFINSLLNGRINLSNLKVSSADFNNSRVEGGYINLLNFDFNFLANRYTALLLKQEAYKNHNTIEALKFYSEEMRLHRKEIKTDINSIIKNRNMSFFKRFLEVSKKWSDNFSLYSAYLFSNNGQNWLRALIVTLFSTFFIFTIFYIDLNNIFCPYFFEEFIKYIIPTNYDLLYSYISLDNRINIIVKILGTILYFLGKIVFWYGSYHIVTSFKKFLRSG